MQTGAVLSQCRRYRYALWRTWSESKDKVLFIGLNPARANETRNDNTIQRCIAYAGQWGFGGIIMANLFAYRTVSPQQLKCSKDPVGPDNDIWLKRLQQEAYTTVAMWGNHGSFQQRSDQVVKLFPKLMCLKITAAGQPHHTRGLANGIKPIPFRPT